MLELILSIAGILVILSLARLGTLFGVFYELTSSLLLFLAMLITLRYWYELARWVESVWPGAGAYGVFGSYWAMFLVGCLPLIVVLNRVTARSVPRYPKFVDRIMGVIFGFIAACILVCCIFTSLSVIMPKIWDQYHREALTFPFDRMPIDVYQHIERNWLGISENDPGHTRFPTFEKADADNFQKYWR